MILDQNLVIYTAFYKESESEVKKCKENQWKTKHNQDKKNEGKPMFPYSLTLK